MFRKKGLRKIIFFILFALFITWLVLTPQFPLTVEDGTMIVLVVFLIQAWIEKKRLLKKLSVKFNSQKELIKSLFMNCPDLVYHKNKELRYCICNPVMKRMLNLDDDESITDKTDFDLFPKETAELIRKYEKSVVDKGQVVSYKVEKKSFNGEIKFYDTLLAPIQERDEIVGVMGIMRDITQMELLKEKILIQNAQLNSILDHIPFLIYLKDTEGRFITGNKHLEEAVGRKKEDIIGLQPQDLYMEMYAEEIKAEDARVIKEKQSIFMDKQIEYLSNKPEWYRIIKSPIFDCNNEVIGIIVLVKNIEDEKEIESQKETLVATLTHDLKTPTTAQTNAMKLLLNESMGTLNEDQKEMVQLALNSNIYMSHMISTILATYKAENGKATLKCEEFDFIELVNSTCKEVSNLAMTKNQNLILKTEMKNSTIFADKLQIKRAVMNLISNAITYGFDNTDIEIKIEDTDETAICNVINHARFIPPAKINEIFAKFQTSPGAKFNKASTGLGLFLSKQIITAHKGEIHAASTEDEICTFGFSIPKAIVAAKSEKPQKEGSI